MLHKHPVAHFYEPYRQVWRARVAVRGGQRPRGIDSMRTHAYLPRNSVLKQQ